MNSIVKGDLLAVTESHLISPALLLRSALLGRFVRAVRAVGVTVTKPVTDQTKLRC